MPNSTAVAPADESASKEVTATPEGKKLHLAALVVGEAGIVEHVNGRRRVVIRLMEMGLVEGTPVKVTRVAPLGDPIELEVRGYRLSIRRAQAELIEIRRVSSTSESSRAGD